MIYKVEFREKNAQYAVWTDIHVKANSIQQALEKAEKWVAKAYPGIPLVIRSISQTNLEVV